MGAISQSKCSNRNL